MVGSASKSKRFPGRIAFLPSVFACLAVCLLSAAAAHADVMKWTVDGVAREAIVVAPSKKDASGKTPVIFAFHGHGDTMHGAAEGMQLERYWPEAVIVYPQGLPTNPSADPEGWGWVYNTGEDGQRDVKFVDAMLMTLHEKYAVDDQRIFATGFSNGAMFTYELWDARSNIFAAFAVVAGRIVPAVHLTVPKPLMVVAGKRDPNVKFQDQLDSINAVRALDGTSETGTDCGGGCTTYDSSKGTPVVTFIHNGGHLYPPGTPFFTVQFFKNYAIAK